MGRITAIYGFFENLCKKSLKEISSLKDELGEDYLYKEKERFKELIKEIIIAVENRAY